jgi:hypothetical protein
MDIAKNDILFLLKQFSWAREGIDFPLLNGFESAASVKENRLFSAELKTEHSQPEPLLQVISKSFFLQSRMIRE